MLSIFEQEFNVETLIDGGVVFDHFMPHTSKKHDIMESLQKHGFKLMLNMISMSESFLQHFEPINLIADYYGEKYALFLAFFFHHVGWMLIPAVFGTILTVYHIVEAVKAMEEGDWFMTTYL